MIDNFIAQAETAMPSSCKEFMIPMLVIPCITLGIRLCRNIRNRGSRINFIITQIDLDASAIMKLTQVKLIFSYIFRKAKKSDVDRVSTSDFLFKGFLYV
ncbi:hypothetical protein [Paenibacillus crassostreae]|uniref:hypothetical protein n=1 Tax=Paenibacillus crassostreae TaxID=1763538 RepID=UPI0012FF67B3|nr:hypothetical protein [Paenibacillus crassostreae]